MRALKKLFYTTLTVTTMPLVAAAEYSPQAVVFDPNRNVERNSGLGNANPGDIVGRTINWVLGLLVLIALVLVLYAGFLWLTSAGNEDQVKKAKDILTGALFGVVIILASYGLTQYVFANLVNVTTNG